jgi:gliding motility-associated-like protein
MSNIKSALLDKNGCIHKGYPANAGIKETGWYLPNTFTPNGDGLNDVIRPYLIGMKSLTKFSIYNRLGNLVFSTVRDGEGWDGTYMGRKMDSGAYVWILEYMDDANKPVQQKGSLLLLR